MRYFIKTFGCQQNIADSERIAAYYEARGYSRARNIKEADLIVINSCIVRQQAEDRIYGLVNNLKTLKKKNNRLKIILTGCLVGAAAREPEGIFLKRLKERLPQVDQFLPIEEVGFEYEPLREDKKHAFVSISTGCNNYCSFCVVPFSRGKERSRPFKDIIEEIKGLIQKGYSKFTLLGQNVNSYGADILKNSSTYSLPSGKKVKAVKVKHLGRYRIFTLFPYLLEEICKIKGVEKVTFISSNPWDFSDELIRVIAENKNIYRLIHLPVQSGDDNILKKMNRWYTSEQYLSLVEKIKRKVKEVYFSTDIIVGFPGEDEEAFNNTVKLAKEVGFIKAYIACYSPRPGTLAYKQYQDNIPYEEKKRRFHILDKLINLKNKALYRKIVKNF
jgi:tRNA-2-methylthio-N6-dimethylallyladenosine synthase